MYNGQRVMPFVEVDPAEPEQDSSSAELEGPQDVSMTKGAGTGKARKRVHGDVATLRQEICRRGPTGTKGDVHVMVRLQGEVGQLSGGGLSESERVHSPTSSFQAGSLSHSRFRCSTFSSALAASSRVL
jgi:hypothetical protein